MRGRWKAVRRVLILAGVGLAAALALAVGALLLSSPGRPRPFLDEAGRPLAGSISEKLRVRIGGVEQGMFVSGKDRSRPVLLFLHGGPGMPEYAISRRYALVLEELFTVCWWEQRGAGLSNHGAVPPETVTVEQLVADTLEVTDHLRARFGQDRIYLFAHSWGTVLGLLAAARAPERYRAYVAMAQITRQLESEKEAYRYMLERYRAAGDRRMVRALEAVPLPALDAMPPAYRALRDEAMHELGVGTTREMRSVVGGIFVPVMTAPAYTLGEKVALWRGKWSSHATAMWDRMLTTDLPAEVPRLDLPVYFLHGAFDRTVSYALAKDYAARLEAPGKGFYTFPASAHSPLFEEPELARRVLRDDVLAGVHDLADPR
jgi:pimeloyl-ACP methyl ester carboxylesterase